MSLVYDRKTQKISEEPQYGGGSLNFLYKNAIGRLMLRFFVGHLFSDINAALNKTKRSQQKIAPFIEKYHIDASAYNLDDFDSFASFFTRQNLSLKPVLAKNIFISPAQAKLSVYKITKGQTITIKNSQYSIEDLIGDSGGSYSCRIAVVREKLSRQPGLNSFMCHIVRDGRNVFYC